MTPLPTEEVDSEHARVLALMEGIGAAEVGGGELVDLVAARLFAGVAPEAKVGRFTLLEVVGNGAMGTVYAARDPEYGERVALKLLRRSERPEQDELGRARLVREARVLARVEHPNLVQLRAWGEHADEAFVVMQFIEGPSLRAWTQASPRTWDQVVGVYVEAGRGLAAVHAIGLVHRDFKAENVLFGSDGRPRVVDFGLARPVDPAAFEKAISAQGAVPGFAYSLTGSGMVAGTLAYMAPELLTGSAATARSDLYAFCTALLEGLEGLDPPGAIIDVLLRGIAVEPSARWPDLAGLLAALERESALELSVSSRHRWLALITFGVGAVLALGLGIGWVLRAG